MLRIVPAVLVTIAAVTLACPPAAWLADWIGGRSPLRLVYPSGTLWNGSALLGIDDGRDLRLVPGRLHWRADWAALRTGRLAISLRHPALDAAVGVAWTGRALAVTGGTLQLPAATLVAAGAPFNTVRPGGRLRAHWSQLVVTAAGFGGTIDADWTDAQSVLSPIAPLGDFHLTARGSGERAETRVSTLAGPLRIDGRGTLADGRFHFTGTVDASPEMRASLDGLIGVLGRRTGNGVILDWELVR